MGEFPIGIFHQSVTIGAYQIVTGSRGGRAGAD
jgi:hypothetical protein